MGIATGGGVLCTGDGVATGGGGLATGTDIALGRLSAVVSIGIKLVFLPLLVGAGEAPLLFISAPSVSCQLCERDGGFVIQCR